MKLKAHGSPAPNITRSEARPDSAAYSRQRAGSSGFAQSTRPPNPAERKDRAIARPLPDVFPEPVPPKIIVPSQASFIRHGSTPIATRDW